MSAPRSVAIDAFLAKVVRELPAKLFTASTALKDEIVSQLSTKGTGRLYRRVAVRYGKQRKDGTRGQLKARASDFHQASVAGAPPAVDTGYLRASAFVNRTGPLQYTVGVASAYAKALEFGTPRIAPRPFMRPAEAAWRTKVGALFTKGTP